MILDPAAAGLESKMRVSAPMAWSTVGISDAAEGILKCSSMTFGRLLLGDTLALHVDYLFTILFGERALLWTRQDVQHQLGRTA